MKILFQSYNTCCQNKSGGVQNRVRKIHDLLIEKGLVVDYFKTFETKLIDYDVLHVFMLEEENYNLIRYAKDIGVPVVISSIVSLNTGYKIDFYRNIIDKLPISTTYQRMMLSANLADMIITETPKEAAFISKHYKVNPERITVIPNGAEPLLNGDDSIFQEIGGKKKYVLQVGRFDHNKNQLSVIKALKGQKYDAVFVGGPSNKSKDYYNECLLEAEKYDNIHFLGWQDANSSLLLSAYKNATVVILPSYNETFGLVALEGAMAGAQLALSSSLPICDFDVFQSVPKFKPNDVIKIREVVADLFESTQSPALKKNIMEYFSWENIINRHLDLYSRLKYEKNNR